MNQEYIIKDPRPLEAFKDKTFSGFKKRDVINSLIKSIEANKVENACYWCTECIISGYCKDILEKLILLNSKSQTISLQYTYLDSLHEYNIQF